MEEYDGRDYGSISNKGYHTGSTDVSLSNSYISARAMEKILVEINSSMKEKDATVLDNAKNYVDDASDKLRKYTDSCCAIIYNAIDEDQKARDYETNERINILAGDINNKIEQYLKIMNTMSDINKLQDQRITRIENNTYKRTLILGCTLLATLFALITSTIVLGTKVNTLEHQVSAYETQIISEENAND